jgi:hypothetical protein
VLRSQNCQSDWVVIPVVGTSTLVVASAESSVSEQTRCTEVCPKSPFHAKEFLPGGVPYDPNPRELFRGLTA